VFQKSYLVNGLGSGGMASASKAARMAELYPARPASCRGPRQTRTAGLGVPSLIPAGIGTVTPQCWGGCPSFVEANPDSAGRY
jgi:hypothetical protein